MLRTADSIGALAALLALASAAPAGELAAVLRPTTVHDVPSEAAAPSGQAMTGDTYAVARAQGGWVEIQYSERTAWVRATDVQLEEATLKRTTANLNVRTGPGTEHAILATLDRGTWLAERGGTGTWRMISFRGETAWVFGEFLEREVDPLGGSRRAATSAPDGGARAGRGGRDAATTADSRRGAAGASESRSRGGDTLNRVGGGVGAPAATDAREADRSGARSQPGSDARPEREEREERAAPPGANRTAIFEGTRNAGQRGQQKIGTITINGQRYPFRSGGYGRGNLPPGDYRVTPHRWSRSESSYSVGGVGFTFALNDAYDPRVRARRTLLRIHPDGGVPGTEGCIGIVGDAATQRRFRDDMRAELNRSGGSFTLTVR